MIRKQLPQGRYLVFISSNRDCLGGLNECIFGYDNVKQGLTKLEEFSQKSSRMATTCTYEVMDTERREYLTYRCKEDFVEHLEEELEEFRRRVSNKRNH